MITLTESAKIKALKLLEDEQDSNMNLRVFVQGGGCNGFQYGFTFDSEKNEDDFEIKLGARSVLIDPFSLEYLNNAVIDYKEDLEGSRFMIDNPNVNSTCGCGSSFSI